MSRAVGIVLGVALVLSACKKSTPTCERALKHGRALVQSDPNAPSEIKEKFAGKDDAYFADAIAACERRTPKAEDLQCMLDAETFAAFRVCDRRARGHE